VRPFEHGITKDEQAAIEKELGELLYKTNGLHDEKTCHRMGVTILRQLVRKLRPDLLDKGNYARPQT
jgi:hypothetical protein